MATEQTTVTQLGSGNKAKVDNSKKKSTKISISIGAVVLVAIVAVFAMRGSNGSGSKGASALTGGVWTIEEGRRAPSGFPDEIEFFSDGTCLCDGIYGDTNNARYSVDGKRLKITIVWDALTYDFEVKGNTLSLTDWDDTVIYKRER